MTQIVHPAAFNRTHSVRPFAY